MDQGTRKDLLKISIEDMTYNSINGSNNKVGAGSGSLNGSNCPSHESSEHHSHTRSMNPKFMSGIGKHTTAINPADKELKYTNSTSLGLFSSELDPQPPLSKDFGFMTRPSSCSIPTLDRPRIQSKFTDEQSLAAYLTKTTSSPGLGQAHDGKEEELLEEMNVSSEENEDFQQKEAVEGPRLSLKKFKSINNSPNRLVSKKLSLFGKRQEDPQK